MRAGSDWAWPSHWYSRFRLRLRSQPPPVDLAYRSAVGIVGMAVVVIGLVMIPYSGPGWLVVFTGLAVLGTEFHWARRVRRFLRRRYDRWTGWLRRQPPGVCLVVIAGTAAAILLTLWLVGTLGLVASWTGLRWSWVRSPLL